MRLVLSVSALHLLLLGLNAFSSAGAFTIRQYVDRTVATTFKTRLAARPSDAAKLVPNDPYINVLRAYQKRGGGTPIIPDASPPPLDASPAISAPPLPIENLVPESISTGATDAVTSAADAVTSAVDAVTSAADTATSSASSGSPVNDAIDAATASASAAAERAGRAAESITAAYAAKLKAAAASKAAAKAAAVAAAAAGGGSGPAEGKALILSDYIKAVLSNDPTVRLSGANDFDAIVANAKDKFEIMRENLLRAQTAFEATTTTSGGMGEVDFSRFGFPSGSVSPGLQNFATALHVQEYGAWYAVALAFLLAAAQRQKGKEDAFVEYEAELARARARADEAAEAAAQAAKGAAMAKDLAKKMDSKSGGVEMLVESSRLRELQVEKEIMQKEIERLTAETADLRKQLQMVLSEQARAVSVAEVKKMPTVKETIPRDPDEDARIIEVLKEIDEKNAAAKAEKKKAAAEKAAESEAAAKKAAEKEAAAKAAAEAEAAAKKAAEEEAAAKAAAEAEAAARKAAEAEAAAKAAAEAEAAAKKAAEAEAAAKAAAEAQEAVAAKSTKRKTTTATKTAPKKKATAKKVAKKKKVEEFIELGADDSSHPWSSLSESTLKRKTVAELAEYLSERGVAVTNHEGKKLKKAELVSAVQTL